jgi:hypothetical protein
MNQTAIDRASCMKIGEKLLLMHDFQNPNDNYAIAIRTSESTHQDVHLIGYCPRYLAKEIAALRQRNIEISVVVKKVNRSAPLRLMIACTLSAPWPKGFKAFDDDKFEPYIISDI